MTTQKNTRKFRSRKGRRTQTRSFKKEKLQKSGGDSNENFNGLIEKLEKEVSFKSSATNDSIYVKHKELSKSKKNILYIVDMQYGFSEYRSSRDQEFAKVNEVLKPTSQEYLTPTWDDDKIPAHFRYINGEKSKGVLSGGTFSVDDSGKTAQKISDLIGELLKSTSETGEFKIVISRDYHPPDHCSFSGDYGEYKMRNPDGFPPHCVKGTFESAIHFTLYQKIKEIVEKVELNKKVKIYVAFKGVHPHIESYGVHKYHDTDYPAKLRQGSCFSHYTDCHKTSRPSCGALLHGGSYLAQLTKENLAQYLLGTVEMTEFPGASFQPFHEHGAYSMLVDGQNSTNYYVCGLAADFCVKDTAINLATHMPGCNIKVVDSCVSYARLPFLVLKMIPMYASKLYLNFVMDRHRVGGSDYYIFDSAGKQINKDSYLTLKKSFFEHRLGNPMESIENAVRGWLDKNPDLALYKMYLSNAFDILHDYHRYGVEILKKL